MDRVYAAFRSVPDYHAPTPPLVSLHKTLDGAIFALYPDREDFRKAFRPGHKAGYWVGPDGFGHVELIEVKN